MSKGKCVAGTGNWGPCEHLFAVWGEQRVVFRNVRVRTTLMLNL